MSPDAQARIKIQPDELMGVSALANANNDK